MKCCDLCTLIKGVYTLTMLLNTPHLHLVSACYDDLRCAI